MCHEFKMYDNTRPKSMVTWLEVGKQTLAGFVFTVYIYILKLNKTPVTVARDVSMSGTWMHANFEKNIIGFEQHDFGWF